MHARPCFLRQSKTPWTLLLGLLVLFFLHSYISCAALDRQAASVPFILCGPCCQNQDSKKQRAVVFATMRLSASDQDIVDGDVDCRRKKHVSSVHQRDIQSRLLHLHPPFPSSYSCSQHHPNPTPAPSKQEIRTVRKGLGTYSA